MSRGSLLAVPTCGAVVLATIFAVTGTCARAWGDEQRSLAIELNKVENTEQGCRSVFLFDNRTGRQLNRFRVDLALFDDHGVLARQLQLDMAPLYEAKKTVAAFVLDDMPCDQIGSILINRVPLCEDGAGAHVDCIGLLEVRSRSDIPLEK